MNNKGHIAVWIIALVVVLFLVWGLIGATEARDEGVTCDMGLAETFCWKWHTNTYGEIGEFFDDLGEDS